MYFSALDNSDPRINGRQYEIAYPVTGIQEIAARLGKLSGVTSELEITTAWDYAPPIPRGIDPQVDMATQNGTSSVPFQYVPWLTGMWQRLDLAISRDSVMLDFGCGVGECVDQFRQTGFNAYGCDIVFPKEPDARLKTHLAPGTIRQIQSEPYRIPFDDDMFDVVLSFQVFEHVMDYDPVLAEIQRILKPGGVSVHVFPGRWRVIEGHTFVPFASVLKAYWWLYLWALLGIRNEYAAGLSANETARRYSNWLKEHTNYLSRTQIREYVSKYFSDCRFAAERDFYPAHARLFNRFPFLLPIYRMWYSETEMRVLVFGKDK